MDTLYITPVKTNGSHRIPNERKYPPSVGTTDLGRSEGFLEECRRALTQRID